MLFLKKIRIEGFKSANKTVEVQLASCQSSVIFGDNGAGKTTFLKILNAIFKQDETVLIEEEVNTITIDYDTNINASTSNTKQQVIIKRMTTQKEEVIEHKTSLRSTSFEKRVQHSFFEDDTSYIRYDWKAFTESILAQSKSLSLGVERGSQSTRLNINHKILFNFLSKRRDVRGAFGHLSQMQEFVEELLIFLRRRSTSSSRGTSTICDVLN
jgi:ABC-type cobalamin/Fe3+-siderophores transport system ATPase subunit